VETPFQTLIAFLHVADLDTADVLEVRGMVAAAARSLLEDDPRLPDLQGCEEELWQGSMPLESLKRLVANWEAYEQPELVPEGVLLEQEFRRAAAELREEEWATDAYQGALRAVEAYEAGDDQALENWSRAMSERLEQAWSAYSEVPVMSDEITAETVVGHRLLKEGFQGWFDAQEMLILAVEEQGDFDEGLARAEEACRLLAAVQKLASRVSHSAA
jgi:hypothetical protein